MTNKPAVSRGRNSPTRQPLIGAIDQGTSSTRFLVFENETGKLLASSQIEIKRLTPKEGWIEMDPMTIMQSVHQTIGEVCQKLEAGEGHLLEQLSCIGICNQRESTVVWDSETGLPLYNVIVWMDNRTKDLVDNMIDATPGRDINFLKDKTGLPMSTYFSAFKLKWLMDNVEDVRRAQERGTLLFGTVDSWILWNLTGNHLTDVTNASRTFLMDIETLQWDKKLCKHFDVPMQILPKILASADDFGPIKAGPLRGLPVTGVIGDQSAALFGHNCLQLGQTKATFGTGCFIMQNIGPGPLHGALKGTHREAKRGLITTVGYKLRDRPACYALEGSIKIAGASLTWLRDNMQLISNYEECDHLINMTSHAAGVFFVPALGGLYSPYWDPNAAGLYIGLSQFSRREHVVRATFDSIAFQTNDILCLMRGVASGLMIDGGLCKSNNMCQILADITGYDIVRPAMCETSALGAAMVAGCGANLWSYESMMCASHNSPNDSLLPANRKHHYPHESLHHEGNFSLLIESKQHLVSSSAGDEPAGHLDAGGGVNDDAGGGGYPSDESPLISELGDADCLADGDSPRPGGTPDNLISTSICHLGVAQSIQPVSSGYSSIGEELLASTSTSSLRNRDSPTLLTQISSSPTFASPADEELVDMDHPPATTMTVLSDKTQEPQELEDELELAAKMSCSSELPKCENLLANDDHDGESLAQEQCIPLVGKQVDVFQSYISLEHRTELVDNWRRAVERSMQWTKVHHEEVRKIDYQRLSSLPISMYLFFSIGMVAFSNFVTNGTFGQLS